MSGLNFAPMDEDEKKEFEKRKNALRSEVVCAKNQAKQLSEEYMAMIEEWENVDPAIKKLDHPPIVILNEVFLIWSLPNERYHSTYLAINGVFHNINRALDALDRDANDFTQDPFREVTELNAEDAAGPLETAHMHVATAVAAMEGVSARFKTYRGLFNEVRSNSFAYICEARRAND